jgi:acyl-CoA reductase-like NAD-dependent aldehyde dehydrogenase
MADTSKPVLQAAELALAAHEAAMQWADATQADVDRVTEAMAQAGHDNAARLAQMAHDETGYGRADHKTFKNIFTTKRYLDGIRHIPTVGVIASDPARGVVEIAEPVGVIAGLVPVTNPTATTLFYGIAAVRARNAIVNAPHPRAVRTIAETARVLDEAATAAGAPPNLVTAMTEVSLDGTQALMAHYRTDLVLATGSRIMVLAAYSSGKPTYAVGPGNSPSYVHRSTRDLGEAAAGILASKTFDNGTACASEQAVIVDASVATAMRAELERRGAYFATPPEQEKLSALLFPNGPGTAFNVESVGQFATKLAQMAGITVPAGTRALVVQPAGVGREHTLSHELLCPVLKWYVAPTEDAGIAIATALLKYGGDGHTAAIHAEDQAVIAKYSKVPAYRICVNSPTLFGAMGFTTGFVPSFTLGTGTIGGTISSDNIGPGHLINRKRVGVAIRSWRESGIGEDLPALLGGLGQPAATAPAPAVAVPAPANATARLDLPPLPAAQAALMGDSQLPAARLTPPAPQPQRVRSAPATLDIKTIVREAIEEVISR